MKIKLVMVGKKIKNKEKKGIEDVEPNTERLEDIEKKRKDNVMRIRVYTNQS